MRSGEHYLSDLILEIFKTEGNLPSEIWLNQSSHAYFRNAGDRSKIATVDNVICYVAKQIKPGTVEYLPKEIGRGSAPVMRTIEFPVELNGGEEK